MTAAGSPCGSRPCSFAQVSSAAASERDDVGGGRRRSRHGAEGRNREGAGAEDPDGRPKATTRHGNSRWFDVTLGDLRQGPG